MIEISKSAIGEVQRMQRVHQQTNAKFRIGLAEGGCKSFYYTIDLQDSIDPNFTIHELGGISIAIDPQHLQYLDRLKLDYCEDLMGGGFRFENPAATSVCGCGNSFDVANL